MAADPPRNTWARIERADVDPDLVEQTSGPFAGPLLSLARSTRAAVISIERLDGAEQRLPNYRYMPFEDPAQHAPLQARAAEYYLVMSASAAARTARDARLWLDPNARRGGVEEHLRVLLSGAGDLHDDPLRLNDTEESERLGFFSAADDVQLRDTVELLSLLPAAAGDYASSAARFAESLRG